MPPRNISGCDEVEFTFWTSRNMLLIFSVLFSFFALNYAWSSKLSILDWCGGTTNPCSNWPSQWKLCDSLGGLYWNSGRFCAFQANSTPFSVIDQCYNKDDCTYSSPWDYCVAHGIPFGPNERLCFLNYTVTMLDQCYHTLQGKACSYQKPWNLCSEPFFPGEPTLNGRACVVNGTIEILDQCEGTYQSGSCTTTDPWDLCDKLNTVAYNNGRFCAFRVLTPVPNVFDYKIALITVAVIAVILFIGFMTLLFYLFARSSKSHQYSQVQ